MLRGHNSSSLTQAINGSSAIIRNAMDVLGVLCMVLAVAVLESEGTELAHISYTQITTDITVANFL